MSSTIILLAQPNPGHINTASSNSPDHIFGRYTIFAPIVVIKSLNPLPEMSLAIIFQISHGYNSVAVQKLPDHNHGKTRNASHQPIIISSIPLLSRSTIFIDESKPKYHTLSLGKSTHSNKDQLDNILFPLIAIGFCRTQPLFDSSCIDCAIKSHVNIHC